MILLKLRVNFKFNKKYMAELEILFIHIIHIKFYGTYRKKTNNKIYIIITIFLEDNILLLLLFLAPRCT